MYLQLLPEFIGLVLTPTAIAGCILLLESKHPYGNALAFGAAFLLLYGVICALVIVMHDSVETTSQTAHTKSVGSLIVGLLFLLLGVVMVLHHKRTREGPPKWAAILDTAQPTGAFIAGFALSLANPNIFLLLSGLTIVVAEATSRGQQIGGSAMLLGGVALDFVVPIVLFAVLGARARRVLDVGKAWLVTHDRPLLLGILFGFGGVFTLRGLNGIL